MLACSAPPAEHARWTLRLLAEKLIELGVVEYLSHVTVCEHLKNTLQPRRASSGAQDADRRSDAIRAARGQAEDVWDVYQRPYDPLRPVVCLDEKSKERPGMPRGALPGL